MQIVEDKPDRDKLLAKLAEEHFSVRTKGYEPSPRIGWPRKHQLWPCVRLGVAALWLAERGRLNTPSKRRAFNFLRGHSHEALMTEFPSLVIVYEGVGNEVDEWTGDPEAPFTEIKSTVISSARMLPIVQKGTFGLLDPLEDSFFRSYFEQCCQNCVAVNAPSCRLRVFFMNGEYADRRKACPACKGPLETVLSSDLYKLCPRCGYKCYAIDIRSYRLTFTNKELSYYRKEVFKKRRDQFSLARQSETESELLMRAEGTECFLCTRCPIGREIGCEHAKG